MYVVLNTVVTSNSDVLEKSSFHNMKRLNFMIDNQHYNMYSNKNNVFVGR